jgi:hypothetical protein
MPDLIDAHHLAASAGGVGQRAEQVHDGRHAQLAPDGPTWRMAGCSSGANMKTMPASLRGRAPCRRGIELDAHVERLEDVGAAAA